MTIAYPVIIKYSDFELGIFKTEQLFFDESGCEEEDFLPHLVYIYDSEGRILEYNQKAWKLTIAPGGEKIPKHEIIEHFKEHMNYCAPQEHRDTFAREAPNLSVRELILLGVRLS
ncbi:MAG: hypothetical protein NXI24_24740 [bacterium]|nr:hypothetical protein [bacterium]